MRRIRRSAGVGASRISPTGCEALVQFILRGFQATLEHRNTGQISAVLQVFELFTQRHLLQKKPGSCTVTSSGSSPPFRASRYRARRGLLASDKPVEARGLL